MANGETGNKQLQEMAEITASVVALTNKFHQQMEVRDKKEADKDTQLAAFMQQMQQLAEATMALILGVNANMGTNSNPDRSNETTMCKHGGKNTNQRIASHFWKMQAQRKRPLKGSTK